MGRKKGRKKSSLASLKGVNSAAATVLILGIATIVIPLVVSVTGENQFRLPKELALRATAILVMLTGVFSLTTGVVDWSGVRRARHVVILAGLIAVWTIVATLASTNRRLSYDSLITVVCSIAIFLAAMISASRAPILLFDLLLAGACLNAVVVTLQEYGVWNPFAFSELVERHSRSSAFIGNPN